MFRWQRFSSRASVAAIVIPIVVAAGTALVIRAWASTTFFDAFFANFIATVAGIVAGVPLSLRLAQREMSSYEAAAAQKAASEASSRRLTVLRLLRAEIHENLENLSQRVADADRPRQHLVPFLRRDVWEAMSEYTTPGLAYVVEMEHFEAKMGGSKDITPVTLRVTTILRPEGGTWKIVHRHADPIATTRPAASVVQT